jgi:succinoglycan biosynthesis transport protein ExoP
VADDGTIGSWSDYLQSQICILESHAVAARAYATISSQTDQPATSDEAIERFRESIQVRQVKGSRLVLVNAKARRPEEAARRANAVVESYVELRLETLRHSSRQAYSWLTAQISTVKDKVESSDRALVELGRDESPLSIEARQQLMANRIEALDRHLVQATVRRTELEARLAVLSGLRGSSELYYALPEETLTQTANDLAVEVANNEQALAKSLLELKPQHPTVARLEAAVGISKARLQQELASVISGIESAHRIACANQDRVRRDLEAVKTQSAHLAELSIRHDVLEREATSNREMYQLLLERLRQSDIGGQVTIDNINIVDRALPPAHPDSGLSIRKLAVMVVLGACLGVALCHCADLLERSDRHSPIPDPHAQPELSPHGSPPPAFSGGDGWRKAPGSCRSQRPTGCDGGQTWPHLSRGALHRRGSTP